MADKGKILIVGSLAYDHVMQYRGLIKDVLIAGNYNMSLTADSREVYYGGCAGNIAYSLSLLGEKPLIFTSAGKDFKEYKNWLTDKGIDTSAVIESDKYLTASAFILTDREQNQITLFEPGAMSALSKKHSLLNLPDKNISYAIIAPDKPERMYRSANECRDLKIPYIFDPGQQINIFSKADILKSVKNAEVLIANEYESNLLMKKLNCTPEEIAELARIYIETHGERGCIVKDGKNEFIVKAVTPSRLIDPTGCGDAFRSGLLAGLSRGCKIKKAVQMGTLLATYSIEQSGTQSHFFTYSEFACRFRNIFGSSL